MARRILCGLAIVVLACVAPHASGAAPAWNCPMLRDWCGGSDGTWWRRLPAAAKAPVVQGMIAAYELAYNQGQFDTVSAWVTAYEDDRNEAASKKFHALVAGRGVTFSQSTPVYVAAIDRFYARYPAKRALKVMGVLRCLRDNPEASCDQVGTSLLLPWPTGV
jgi:hypothetical protein